MKEKKIKEKGEGVSSSENEISQEDEAELLKGLEAEDDSNTFEQRLLNARFAKQLARRASIIAALQSSQF